MAIRRNLFGRRAWAASASAGALLLVASVTPATADDDEHPLQARLLGANEVPGPGDPDGRGEAEIELDGNRVCFELEWRRIAAPTAAHIHRGAPDEAGPVVVLFFEVTSGLPTAIHEVEGCTTADPATVSAIARHPSRYYVNVHTADFPEGAIRGQLHEEE